MMKVNNLSYLWEIKNNERSEAYIMKNKFCSYVILS